MSQAKPFLEAGKNILAGVINLGTDTLKLALLDNTYVFNKEIQFFDTGANTTSDPSHVELVATNYEKKTLTGSLTFFSSTEDEGYFGVIIPDQVYTDLGGDVDDTIGGAILFKDTGNPATSPVILWIPIVTPTLTDGSTLVADFKSSIQLGQWRIGMPSDEES